MRSCLFIYLFITQLVSGLTISPYSHTLIAGCWQLQDGFWGEGVICVRTSGVGCSRSLLDQEEELAQSYDRCTLGLAQLTVSKTCILTSRRLVGIK